MGEILIVNNAQEPIPFAAAKMRVLQQERNIYVNPAWNLGAEAAGEDLLLISNDDIRIGPEVIDFMHGAVQQAHVGIIGPAASTLNRSGPVKPRLRWVTNVPRGFGTLMAMRRATYQRIPDDALILAGDDWLFWTQPHKNYALSGIRVETPMATTAGATVFTGVKDSDQRWWVANWTNVAGTRQWHQAAFRRNVIENNLAKVRRGVRKVRKLITGGR